MARRLSDPHHTFWTWLAEGTPGEPPRDAALHASVCGECMRQVAALDALRAIDLGRAILPASRLAPHAARRGTASIRWAGAAVAGVMGAVIVGFGATHLLAVPTSSTPSATSDLPAGAVLGATGTPLATTTGAATPSAATATPVATEATATAVPTTQRPATATPPQGVVATQRPATPRPSVSATPTPEPSSATPSPTSTPSPTASPTPSVSSSPSQTSTPEPTDPPATPSPSPS